MMWGYVRSSNGWPVGVRSYLWLSCISADARAMTSGSRIERALHAWCLDNSRSRSCDRGRNGAEHVVPSRSAFEIDNTRDGRGMSVSSASAERNPLQILIHGHHVGTPNHDPLSADGVSRPGMCDPVYISIHWPHAGLEMITRLRALHRNSFSL